MKNQRLSRLGGLALVVLATACWSTSGIFISLVVQGSGISPVGLAFWRDLGTFTCLLIGIGILKPGLLKVNRRDLPWLIAMGIFSIGVFHVLWNMTVLLNGASVATVIQANAPIFVTLMAWLIWKEPLTGQKIVAVGLAFAGTVLLSGLHELGGASITTLGLLTGLGAAVTYGSLSLFGKKLTNDYSPWTILVYIFGTGSLVLLPFQFSSPFPWPLPLTVLGNYTALVLLTTISGFALYTIGLSKLQASIAAITANTEVPFAAILAYLILKERLDGWQVLGAVLIIVGVVLISLPNKRMVEVPA